MKIFNSYQELAAGPGTLHGAPSQMSVSNTEVSVDNAMSEIGSSNYQGELANVPLAIPLVPSPILQQHHPAT